MTRSSGRARPAAVNKLIGDWREQAARDRATADTARTATGRASLIAEAETLDDCARQLADAFRLQGAQPAHAQPLQEVQFSG